MLKRLTTAKELYSKYMTKNHVFKSVVIPSNKNNKRIERVVILKRTPLTITTEKRKSVVNINNSQSRGNEFEVIEIFDKVDPKNTLDETYNHIDYVGINYVRNKTVLYKKGSIVKVDNFDTNLENNNSTGIHFYNSFECAFFESLHHSNLTDPSKFIKHYYTPNGYLVSRTTFPFGKKERWWYDSIQKHLEECTTIYQKSNDFNKSEILIGQHTTWHKNGKIHYKCNFADHGTECIEVVPRIDKYYVKTIDGEYEEYYDDGTLKLKGLYKNQHREGIWNLYCENGMLHTRVTFNKGIKVFYKLFSKKHIYYESDSPFYN